MRPRLLAAVCFVTRDPNSPPHRRAQERRGRIVADTAVIAGGELPAVTEAATLEARGRFDEAYRMLEAAVSSSTYDADISYRLAWNRFQVKN